MPKHKEFNPVFSYDAGLDILTVRNVPGPSADLSRRVLTDSLTALYRGNRPVGLIIFDASLRTPPAPEKFLKSIAYDEKRSLRDITRQLIRDVVSLAGSRKLIGEYPDAFIQQEPVREAV